MSEQRTLPAWILGISLFLGLSALGFLLGKALLDMKQLERSVTVKGLSEHEYPAEIVIWPIQFTEADNDLGNAFVRSILVIDLIPVHEHDDVGILLDGAGLPEVRVDRPLVGTLLQAPVQLGQGNHRTTELLGEPLERAGNLGDLRGSALGVARHPHQL